MPCTLYNSTRWITAGAAFVFGRSLLGAARSGHSSPGLRIPRSTRDGNPATQRAGVAIQASSSRD